MVAASPVLERFWQKFTPEPNSGCWLWVGTIDWCGYGKLHSKEATLFAHRVSYEIHHGPIPAGKEIDHKCRVRSCVNPDHLRAVTHAENMKGIVFEKHRNGAKTHCSRGHVFDEINTHVTKAGVRQCRKCAAMRARKYRKERSHANHQNPNAPI